MILLLTVKNEIGTLRAAAITTTPPSLSFSFIHPFIDIIVVIMSSALLLHDDYCIALYYIYLGIPDAKHHVKFHQELCKRLSLKGRIRVSAKEGLNGVLSGRIQDLQLYEEEFLGQLTTINPQLQKSDLDLKYCRLRTDLTVQEQLFETLQVKETKTVIGLVDLPRKEEKSRKTKKRQVKNQQELSDSELVRQVYEKAMEQFAKEKQQGALASACSNEGSDKDSMHVPHLSPEEWDRQLSGLSEQPEQSVVFLDCRNVYESNVGRFESPHTKTVLTNTRKFSELPQVLVEQSQELSKSTHIFAYCTGGVRCERATVFLKGLLRETHPDRPIPQIFQLRGGIQRYLEHAAVAQQGNEELDPKSNNNSLFKGKNFVFDPRRVDPLNAHDKVVGRCLVCHEPHDDYDNGQAPALDRASRCWNCRVLILVCNQCRSQVSCWGDDDDDDDDAKTNVLPRMYCGGPNQTCWHRPPVQIVTGKNG